MDWIIFPILFNISEEKIYFRKVKVNETSSFFLVINKINISMLVIIERIEKNKVPSLILSKIRFLCS